MLGERRYIEADNHVHQALGEGVTINSLLCEGHRQAPFFAHDIYHFCLFFYVKIINFGCRGGKM